MVKQRPRTKKKRGLIKKVVIFSATAAATTYGTLALLNRDPDPTTWKGERSGYEETK